MKHQVKELRELGGYLKRLRRQQGFTQVDFASQLGMSHVLAGDIEAGKESVKIGNFLKYMDELGIRLYVDFPEGLESDVEGK